MLFYTYIRRPIERKKMIFTQLYGKRLILPFKITKNRFVELFQKYKLPLNFQWVFYRMEKCTKWFYVTRSVHFSQGKSRITSKIGRFFETLSNFKMEKRSSTGKVIYSFCAIVLQTIRRLDEVNWWIQISLNFHILDFHLWGSLMLRKLPWTKWRVGVEEQAGEWVYGVSLISFSVYHGTENPDYRNLDYPDSRL